MTHESNILMHYREAQAHSEHNLISLKNIYIY